MENEIPTKEQVSYLELNNNTFYIVIVLLIFIIGVLMYNNYYCKNIKIKPNKNVKILDDNCVSEQKNNPMVSKGYDLLAEIESFHKKQDNYIENL